MIHISSCCNVFLGFHHSAACVVLRQLNMTVVLLCSNGLLSTVYHCGQVHLGKLVLCGAGNSCGWHKQAGHQAMI